ncbi:type IV toxin-antitoxin system AbiEi family antitoxin domain-containing protein [Streptomyces chartreusis]|uniref:type IV toxin-antitoxin system AbiEi family antitoxin domain-containing protein n=1 Tax=Streptomyces chartreusis TaxID=1969 RepID=UPI003641990C
MDRSEQLTILSGVAADQWGLVTAAQAKDLGLSGVQLLRLAEAGLLESVGRGVYAMPSAGLPQYLEIKVAWLRLQPHAPAWERPLGSPDSGVVSHASACHLHDLGDIPVAEVEITVPRRRTTTEPFVRLRTAPVNPADITVVDGLPVTAPARTIVDLLKAKADGGHVGGVIADAERRDLVDIDELAERMQPCARAYGLASTATGHQLIEHLVEQAGRDLHSQEIVRAGQEGFAAAALLAAHDRNLEGVLGPQYKWDAVAPLLQSLAAEQVRFRGKLNAAMPRILGAGALQEAMRNLHEASGLSKALRDLAMPPGLLKTIHQATPPGYGVLSPATQQALRQTAIRPTVAHALEALHQLEAPDAQRAPGKAAIVRPTVAHALEALRELEQAPSDRATTAAGDDSSEQDEEVQNRLNDTQAPE